MTSNRVFRDAVDPTDARRYREAGWWGDVTLVDHVRRHRDERGDRPAFISDRGTLTWATLDRASDRVATVLANLGVEPGDRVGMLLPDSGTVHAVMLGLEKAGAVIVGLGARAGVREIAHIMTATEATTLLISDQHRDLGPSELRAQLADLGVRVERLVQVPYLEEDLDAPFVVDGEPVEDGPIPDIDARRIRPDDLSIINSTSGTTGLPKCVLHTQNRWLYFHQVAERNGELSSDDVFLGAVPAPFGFGLWTAHFTPIVLGCPTIVRQRFSATQAMADIEQHRVSVLCCVSTQFLMMLNEPTLGDHDLTSLRVMFTGGEAVPAERARRFEENTGCQVLQFYGSNETGFLTGTLTTDPPELRFETAGRVEPDMQVRMYDVDGVHQVEGEGRPACKGPATCIGYLDEGANDKLFTPDGWMLMGDLCTIDDEGYLRVTGRTSDIIIRGGKNISAPVVEEEVSSHPSVALAAAVAKPDEIFGERVHVFVELRPGCDPVTLEELRDHLRARGTSVELIPESLEILDELPRSSGAKVAKGELAQRVRAAG